MRDKTNFLRRVIGGGDFPVAICCHSSKQRQNMINSRWGGGGEVGEGWSVFLFLYFFSVFFTHRGLDHIHDFPHWQLIGSRFSKIALSTLLATNVPSPHLCSH